MQSLIFNNIPLLHRNSLCADFQALSVGTWNLMLNAHSNHFSIGEETITDVNLLALKMRQPHLVHTQKFSRITEGRNGADWLWIIVGRSGATFMLYVQAKRLFINSNRYESLIHPMPNPAEQVDKLIFNKFLYPLGHPVYPIYVFYNYLPNTPKAIGCNCGQAIPTRLSGCSYADAFTIKNEILLGNDHFDDIGKHQYALSCLVCCDGSGKSKSPNSDLATSFFNRIVNQDRFNQTQARKIDVKDREPFSANSFLLKQPPSFVNQIISGKGLDYNPFKQLDVENITILQETEKIG